MLFNSFTYLIFLPFVVLLHWLMPVRLRSWFLLIASYLFYMNWLPAYGPLILGLTIINYFLGLAISTAHKSKRLILILGLCFNIGALCFYKYAAFLADNFWSITQVSNHFLRSIFPQISSVHWTQPNVNIILPLGISFFTFEFIHYIVDVYKGNAPMRNFKDFALFAAFSPRRLLVRSKDMKTFGNSSSSHLHLVRSILAAAYF